MRTLLHEGWTVRAGAGDAPIDVTVPATVPGCVHTDLLTAGLIPDPYLDDNESALAWIGRTQWCYETTFEWAPTLDDHVDLVCEGLDTVATVRLNGVVIATTRNMHRTHRIDVRATLLTGTNTLAVTFDSALDHAERVRDEMGARPHVNRFPFNFVRKMACNFGWDWGPELVTAGIWRPIALESWSTARLTAVRPLVSVDGDVGRVAVHIDVQRTIPTEDDHLLLAVRVGDSAVQTTLPEAMTRTTVEVVVDQPDLWWPCGYGAQPMYPVEVDLIGASGVLSTWRGEIGFRTVRLRTEPDEFGTSFGFVVNGTPVFARGVNWIPDDCFPHRVDRDRYQRRLTQAADAGVNLVRVWGGGIYESEDFYELCDRMGLLVWQDFLFACAAYPEEEPLSGEVVAEAREAITRLCPHPSLVLWNGCNENIWGYHDWDWQRQLGDLTWGAGYYLKVLPDLVAELDPTRPYSPSSPWSLSTDLHPNDPDHGCTHVWDVWNERDYLGYRDYVPRFAAEFGFEGPPRWSTLTRAVHEEPRTPHGPIMLAHQKAADGAAKLDRRLAEHFDEPATFDDWFWATQLNQARALAIGVEHFRSWSPRCAGTVVWQLNDCWPVTSWAVVDGDGGLKPAWYALRRAYQDRLLTVQPRDGGLALVAVNDSGEAWTATVEIRRMSFDGTVIAVQTFPIAIEARATSVVGLPQWVAEPADPSSELLVAMADSTRATWFYGEDKDLALPAPCFVAACTTTTAGYRVTVTATSLLRDLALLADRVAVDAVVDDMLVTLLPGETVSFEVSTAAKLDAADLSGPTVLRCANQLGPSGRTP